MKKLIFWTILLSTTSGFASVNPTISCSGVPGQGLQYVTIRDIGSAVSDTINVFRATPSYDCDQRYLYVRAATTDLSVELAIDSEGYTTNPHHRPTSCWGANNYKGSYIRMKNGYLEYSNTNFTCYIHLRRLSEYGSNCNHVLPEMIPTTQACYN